MKFKPNDEVYFKHYDYCYEGIIQYPCNNNQQYVITKGPMLYKVDEKDICLKNIKPKGLTGQTVLFKNIEGEYVKGVIESYYIKKAYTSEQYMQYIVKSNYDGERIWILTDNDILSVVNSNLTEEDKKDTISIDRDLWKTIADAFGFMSDHLSDGNSEVLNPHYFANVNKMIQEINEKNA